MTTSPFLGARLSALHAASFMSVAFYLPFFPVWLQSKALPPAFIGVILAIPIVVRVLVSAPLLSLADRTFGPRRLLLMSHAGQVIGFPLLAFVDNGFIIAGLVALISVAQAVVIPANDLVTTVEIRRHSGLHYGRIRMWGSIAFLATSVLVGFMIDRFGATAIIVGLAVTPLLGILVTHFVVAERLDPPSTTLEEPKRAIRLPPALWLLMAAAACAQASHAALYAFGSIHWRSLGIDDTVIGYLWAIGVVTEIVVFVFLGQSVGRGSAGLGLLLIGSAATILRFGVLSLDPGLGATFALQALHGLSFGATHLGAMAALAALAPPTVRGRAQGLLGTFLACGAALVTLLSGEIYRVIGPWLFAAVAPLGLMGFVLTLLAWRSLKAQPQRADEGG